MQGHGYKYASLQQFTGAVRSVFARYGLLIVQPIVYLHDKQFIRTDIYHESCDVPIVSSLVPLDPYAEMEDGIDRNTGKPKKTLHNGQKLGAGITYARKYALQAILCLAPDEPDLDLDSARLAPQAERDAPKKETTEVPSRSRDSYAQSPSTATPKAEATKADTEREAALGRLREMHRVEGEKARVLLACKARKMNLSDIAKASTETVLSILAEAEAQNDK
jgi:hypothetical protein